MKLPVRFLAVIFKIQTRRFYNMPRIQNNSKANGTRAKRKNIFMSPDADLKNEKKREMSFFVFLKIESCKFINLQIGITRLHI